MSKTVQGLLEHCKTALKNNVQYVYGAKMQVLTLAQIKTLQNIYGTSYVWTSDLQKAGKLCCDCSGLISSYTGITRSSSSYKSTALECVNITTVKSNWSKYIGWAFWLNGHIGVVSDTEGYYYAMDGSARNMVHYPITKQNWTYAIKLCDIDYTTDIAADISSAAELINSGSFAGTTTANLNIRKYANTNCDILGTIPNGNQINIINKYTNGWYTVNYNNSVGYASSNYINIPTTVFNVKTAINKLALYGCISTKEYWLNHYADLQYLDLLLINMGLNIKKKSTSLAIKEFSAAVNTLVSKGCITTKEYWVANVNKIQYLQELIINAANALM